MAIAIELGHEQKTVEVSLRQRPDRFNYFTQPMDEFEASIAHLKYESAERIQAIREYVMDRASHIEVSIYARALELDTEYQLETSVIWNRGKYNAMNNFMKDAKKDLNDTYALLFEIPRTPARETRKELLLQQYNFWDETEKAITKSGGKIPVQSTLGFVKVTRQHTLLSQLAKPGSK